MSGNRRSSLKPKQAAALQEATHLHQQGQAEAAEQLYKKLLKNAPNLAEAQFGLAVLLLQAGRNNEVVPLLEAVIRHNPNYAMAHNYLGIAHMRLQAWQPALTAFEKAVALEPTMAGAYSDMAGVLEQLGHLPQAVAALQQAVALQPKQVQAHHNLGILLWNLDRRQEAVASMRSAFEADRNNAERANYLASHLIRVKQSREAVDLMRATLKQVPDNPQTLYILANALREEGQLEGAAAAFAKVLDSQPQVIDARVQLIHLKRRLCRWENLQADVDELMARIDADPQAGMLPQMMLSNVADPAWQLANNRRYCQSFVANAAAQTGPLPPLVTPNDGGKIRIGYLSADFRQHVVASLVAELFSQHDRDRFEVYGFGIGEDDGSPLRARIIDSFDRFTDLLGVSAAKAVAAIREQQIHILIDLTGHTAGDRQDIMALRPAPIQVNYLGYTGTSGAPYMDYLIADPVAIPSTSAAYYAEKLVHMPDSYMVNDRLRKVGQKPTRAECGLPEDGLVLCCFNDTYKLTPQVFEVWMKLLLSRPDSVLWLRQYSDHTVGNLRAEAERHGVDGSRLYFADRTEHHADHLARQQCADLFLDTNPYNAHATSSDALWVGLPVLTCAGEGFASRVAASLLHAVGLPQLVTHSMEDYLAVGLALLQEPQQLAHMRAHLLEQREQLPLFDCPRFTRHLETAYTTMWQLWRDGQPPQAITVATQPSHQDTP